MNNTEFMIEVENSHNRSKRVLLKKEKEYAGEEEEDRLEQFYRISEMNHVNPCEALWGMASKHVTPIADMVKEPHDYSLKRWNEKLTDLRNYTHLLDALIRNMGVK